MVFDGFGLLSGRPWRNAMLRQGPENEPYFTFTFLKSTVSFKTAHLYGSSKNEPPSRLGIRASRNLKFWKRQSKKKDENYAKFEQNLPKMYASQKLLF